MAELDHFTGCSSRVREIGRLIKSSKIKHVWEFTYMGVHHSIELIESILTSKKRIIADGVEAFPNQLVKNNLSFSFKLGNAIEVSLIQLGANCELRLNHLPFNHILELERNKQLFKGNTVTSYSNDSVNKKSSQIERPFVSLHELGSLSLSQIGKENSSRLFDFTIKPHQDRKKIQEKFNFNFSVNNNNKHPTFGEDTLKCFTDVNNNKNNNNVNLIDFSSNEDVTSQVHVNVNANENVNVIMPVNVNDLFDIFKPNDRKVACESLAMPSIADISVIPKQPEPTAKESESLVQLVQSIKEKNN